MKGELAYIKLTKQRAKERGIEIGRAANNPGRLFVTFPNGRTFGYLANWYEIGERLGIMTAEDLLLIKQAREASWNESWGKISSANKSRATV